ncbi:MAG: tolB [Gammaproteobacteria bacterium]|jgi:TolB protein|nr:tolB [Gammaproteobacteria bacterium]
MMNWQKFLTVSGLLLAGFAYADSGVNLILTNGSDQATPIAVVPFAGQATDLNAPNNIAGVIAADLRFSGLFKVSDFSSLPATPHEASQVTKDVWHSSKVEDVVVGGVSGDSRKQVSYALVDLVKSQNPQTLLQQAYNVPDSQQRALAHHIADSIFLKLTGIKGIFSTRIAYVQVNPPQYSLLVADADGSNPRPILISKEPIMSPAWSPDGKKIAYVSFENKRAQIYITTIATGQRQLVSEMPGINGAPAWSPDSKKLALVLSKNRFVQIYLLDLASGKLQQLTSGNSINTEPNFAPDGQSIIFTSDRGGNPQIYRLNLTSGKIDRITYSGEYNARASFSADGKLIVMLTRHSGQYDIAVQNLSTGTVTVLTNSGRNDSPTLSPNGMMVLYGNEFGELGLVSVDGRVKLRVPGKGGKVQDPAWGPFTN